MEDLCFNTMELKLSINKTFKGLNLNKINLV